jgi:hypothetical protein
LYNELVTVLRDIILHVGKTDDPGALGTILALLGITEAQGRGALHLHANGWGEVTADDITRHADDGDTMKEIYELVESFVTGEVIPEEVLPGWGEKGTYERERVWYTSDIPTVENIPADSSKINSVINHHGPKCHPTCEPKEKRKDPKCRLGRPARPSSTSKVTELTLDTTTDEFELHR